MIKTEALVLKHFVDFILKPHLSLILRFLYPHYLDSKFFTRFVDAFADITVMTRPMFFSLIVILYNVFITIFANNSFD